MVSATCRYNARSQARRFTRAAKLRNPKASAVRTPSNQTGSDVLSELQKFTTVLPDNTLAPTKVEDFNKSSAVVNMALLSHCLANTSAFYDFANAIEKGVARAAAEAPGDKAAAVVSALTNVAAMLKDKVGGRICIEVDPRLANDADELMAQAQRTVDACTSQGLDTSKLLLQLPGTWAGIQAARGLQEQQVDCEITDVYSIAQAVAAVQARAAVLVLNVTHINVWYDKNPGAIRDPHGPRQDAGLQSDTNMGVRTAAAVYSYAHQQGSSTRLVVTGLRSADEVLALSGVDYMIIPEEVSKQLAARGTLDGYNDGLSASASVEDSGIPALTAETAMKAQLDEQTVAPFDEKSFKEDMGMAGEQLLSDKLEGDYQVAARVEDLLMNMVVARE